jgi:deoxyribonuclease-4
LSLRFGTVGAPHSTPKGGTPAAIQRIREMGMDALELGWVQSVSVKPPTCAEICASAEAHGVKLSVHAPYYINLNSQTADLMHKSDARLLAAARMGFLAGARDIIFHPGSYHSQPPEHVYERAREKLAELQGILRGEGVAVVLRPETMGKRAMFGTLDEVLQLARDVEGVAPCIDVAHLHARAGDGSFNTYDEFAGMLKTVQAALGEDGLRTMHFHISGIEYTQAGEQNHLMLEEADLDWRAFVQACIDFAVEGTLVCESPTQEDDALLVKAAYEELRG